MTRVKIIYFARFSRELNLKRRITKLEIEWTRKGDTYYYDNVYRKRYLTHIFFYSTQSLIFTADRKDCGKYPKMHLMKTHTKKKK